MSETHLCGGDCEDNPTDECADLARWNAEDEELAEGYVIDGDRVLVYRAEVSR